MDGHRQERQVTSCIAFRASTQTDRLEATHTTNRRKNNKYEIVTIRTIYNINNKYVEQCVILTDMRLFISQGELLYIYTCLCHRYSHIIHLRKENDNRMIQVVEYIHG